MHHLVGVAEIADMLSVSRSRADAMTRHPTFPEPTARLDAGRVWETVAIEQWATQRGREINPNWHTKERGQRRRNPKLES